MFEHARSIAPILTELDEIRDLDLPVRVRDDLLPLFQKHTAYNDIHCLPLSSAMLESLQTADIRAFHISNSEKHWAKIFYTPCELHAAESELVQPTCPFCCDARFDQAKELVHLLDAPDQRTTIQSFQDELLTELIDGNYGANAQVRADGAGEEWAVELLVRYRHRIVATGDDRLPEANALRVARANNDFRLIAAKYAVPDWCASHAFAKRTMSAMKAIRQTVGLSIAFPPTKNGN
jgi:hypothetical protein